MVRTVILFILAYLCIGVAYALRSEKTITEAVDAAWGPTHPRRNTGFAITMFVGVILWPLLLLGDGLGKLHKRKETE